jgi:1,4-alpha-glucan branching enzyme
MSEPLGSFCLVLHGHLPYVLRHGQKPHGAAWLYEAVAETYLPLLDLIGESAVNGVNPALTIGLTPILLEQLADEEFKSGFAAYAEERMETADGDRAQFLRQGDQALAALAAGWRNFYQGRLDQFERIGRDIPGQFARRRAEGNIQVLGGSATHAYLPLLLTDESIRAQLSAGAAISARFFGDRPRGMWLPECAYRPASECWVPPVLQGAGMHRPGLEAFLPEAGADHFFVDSHLLSGGVPLGAMADGRMFTASVADAHRDRKAGWREPLEAVGVVSGPARPEVFALARHPRLAEQVWSSKVGYPGDGAYLEFHKKHLPGGLRYWRVTDVCADLPGKEAYDPAAVAGRTYVHAQHFCGMVKDVLREYHSRTGRRGVAVAAFDAELFGHWWFEGPRFLRDVILTLAAEKSVNRLTSDAALVAARPDKMMRLAEGSWGRKGDHSVWMNDETKWMWEVEHRAERDMVKYVRTLAWRTNEKAAECLAWAGRELMLLQASDWPFIVENGSATDYAVKRFSLHSERFERAIEMAKRAAAGAEITGLQEIQLAEMRGHDRVLGEIDLGWWE